MQIATVRSQEIWLSGTQLFCPEVPTPALTPALALDYLGELSTDIESVVVLDRDGKVAAATADVEDRQERMRELTVALLDRAAEAVTGADQLEVQTAEGAVFAVRGAEWTVGVDGGGGRGQEAAGVADVLRPAQRAGGPGGGPGMREKRGPLGRTVGVVA